MILPRTRLVVIAMPFLLVVAAPAGAGGGLPLCDLPPGARMTVDPGPGGRVHALRIDGGQGGLLRFSNPWPGMVVRVRSETTGEEEGHVGREVALLVEPGRRYAAYPVPKMKACMRADPRYLAQVREAAERARAGRIRGAVSRPSNGFMDLRVIIHCHTGVSHDSPGSLEEVVRAAHECEVDAVLFTEHSSRLKDVVREGHRGTREGVILLPGFEEANFLVFPAGERYEPLRPDTRAAIARVLEEGGLVFIAHPEEGRNFEYARVNGMEIYNLHADVKDEASFLESIRGRLREPAGVGVVLTALFELRRDPAALYEVIFDVPEAVLERWDGEGERRRFVGVAGNDSHHNTGVRIFTGDEGDLVVEDLLRKVLSRVPHASVPAWARPLLPSKGAPPWTLELDPYEVTFRLVSTHVLAGERSAAGIRRALREGRCYVAFDWIADPKGFSFEVRGPGGALPMGSEAKLVEGLEARIRVPVSSTIRLLRNGRVIAMARGDRLDHPIGSPGVYRVEAAFPFPELQRPWIYSNPVHIR